MKRYGWSQEMEIICGDSLFRAPYVEILDWGFSDNMSVHLLIEPTKTWFVVVNF